MGPGIHLRQLSVDIGSHRVIDQLDVSFAAGSLSAIVGANGSGKTTLLRTITGLLTPTTGSVTIEAGTRRDLGYLPQRSEVDRSFPITVHDFVASGLWSRCGSWRCLSAQQRSAIDRALIQAGLRDRQRCLIGSLSGGQFQRMVFARLTLQDPGAILLDEPFNAVDGRTVGIMLDTIARWHSQGRTIIVVSHDLPLALHHFPQTLLLNGTASCYGATRDILSPSRLADTRAKPAAGAADIPAVGIA